MRCPAVAGEMAILRQQWRAAFHANLPLVQSDRPENYFRVADHSTDTSSWLPPSPFLDNFRVADQPTTEPKAQN